MAQTYAIINGKIYDYVTYRENGYIIFDDTIIETGDMKDYRPDGKYDHIIDAKGRLVLPGMVNAHSHLYGAYLRGIPLRTFNPMSFKEHLQQLFWYMDKKLNVENSYMSALCLVPEHVKCGVTTIIDHHAAGGQIRGTLNALKRAWVDEAGLRGVFAFETSDRFDVDECIKENVEFYNDNAYKENCGAMFGMHASMTISDRTIDKIASAACNIPLHVHVGESVEDELSCMANYGKTIVERFVDAGIVNENSLFAHCTNVNEREAALMAQNNITAVINPTSNLNCGNGIVDYKMLEKYGVTAAIGNDTLGTNIAADIRNVMYIQHEKTKNTWWFGSNRLKNCLINNYRLASKLLGIRIGRLEPGYAADIITVDYKPISPMNENNIFDHIVDGVFSSFRPDNLWCQGVMKMSSYVTVYDEEKIAALSQETASKLWKEL